MGKYVVGVYGAQSSWRAFFPRNSSACYYCVDFFLFATHCCSLLSSAAMDDILRALNDRGVDSNSLAEVVAEYFCGDSTDSDGMFV